MSVVLREYQKEAVDAIWKEILVKQTALIVCATGLGKTEILIGLIQKSIHLFPEFKCVFLVNKLELLSQTRKRLSHHLGDIVGEFHGKEKNLNMPVTVASVQSIHKIPMKINMLILDETHNVNQGDGRYIDFIEKCKDENHKLKIVGVTATDFRADGYIHGEGKLFSGVCFRKDLLWAVENKFLVPYKLKHQKEKFDTKGLKLRLGDYKTEDIERLTGDEAKMIVQLNNALPQLVDRKKVVWACSSIKHCEMLKKNLDLLGEYAVSLHSEKSSEDRKLSLYDFENGTTRHMAFVTIVSEGYDYPPIDAVILMRPTRSPVLYVQTCGRGLRPSSGKEDCLILDYGGVVESCGPLHKPWVDDGKKKKEKQIPMKFCPNCLEYCEITATNCPICDYEFIKKPRELSLEKLSTQSYQGSFQFEVTRNVLSYKTSRYIAKSGNECLRIEYVLDSISPRAVSEYFNLGGFYASKMYSRLKLFGFDYFKGDDKFSIVGQAVDLKIKLVKEKNYWKVENVFKV